MGTTTNNGWTYPESTDLVKDGATAIETLATNIDTTLGVYATPMGVHLSTVTFSGVTSVSLAADTFTSTYDDYRIIYQLSAYGTDGTTSIRLRAAGSDNSTANYANGVFFSRTNNTSGIFVGNKGQTSFSINTGDSAASAGANAGSLDIISPKLSTNTILNGITTGVTTDGAEFNIFYNAHIFQSTTSFDSLSLIFPGNSTGRISVYGYNK